MMSSYWHDMGARPFTLTVRLHLFAHRDTLHEQHKGKIMDYASEGMVFYLFGLFCAYWAQSTKRNAWLWFFLGLFFAPITGLVLLYKNSQDRAAEPSAGAA